MHRHGHDLKSKGAAVPRTRARNDHVGRRQHFVIFGAHDSNVNEILCIIADPNLTSRAIARYGEFHRTDRGMCGVFHKGTKINYGTVKNMAYRARVSLQTENRRELICDCHRRGLSFDTSRLRHTLQPEP
jgi:hypothetical protein